MANKTTTTKRTRKNSFGTVNGCEAHNVADCARCKPRRSNPIAAPVVIAPETNEADYTPAQRAAAHFQTIPTDVLTAFVRGDVNALATVLDELANRGRNPLTGEWIGFEGAAQEAAKLKDVLDARELPKVRISRDGRREYLTNDPNGARLVYVTVPE